MNTANKLVHKNVVLPTLPDHSESRRFQNIAMTACLSMALISAVSLIVLMV